MDNDDELKKAAALINKKIEKTIDLANDVVRGYFEGKNSPKDSFRPFVITMPEGTFILWNRHDRKYGNWEVIRASLNGKVPASAFGRASQGERQVLLDIENILAVFRKHLKVLQGVLKMLKKLE